MRCQICGVNRATIHINQFKDGKYIFIDVCEECAVKKGLIPQTDITKLIEETLEKLLSKGEKIDLFNNQYVLKPRRIKKSKPKKQQDEKTCPQCGFALSNLAIDESLGCPNDYEVFKSEIDKILLEIHKSNRYEGSANPSKSYTGSLRLKLRRLKAELNQAISVENYELAAKLRDEIKEMESKVKKDE